MKTFRDIMKNRLTESPVGVVGRTKEEEAMEHIENSDVAKRFRKIVRELGGKTVARQLLAGMSSTGFKVSNSANVTEKQETIEDYLRDAGFKLKSEDPTKNGTELEFFKKSQAEEAFEDLKLAGFMKSYDISLSNNIITYNII